MPVNFDFSLEPKAAYDYLDGKGYQLSYHYDELDGYAHQLGFTAAKVTRLDLLQDLHQSLLTAQKAGTPFKRWLNDLKPTLKKKGWWGEKDIVDPKTGEVQTVHIGGKRLKHIFDTNMRSSYNVGRYKKQRRLSKAEYWRYTSLLLPTSRDEHSRMHGTVLHRDNPFWQINYPLNGHGCKCKVRAYTKAQAKARKMTITEDTPESIAHPDWAYDVGAGARVGRISQLNLDNSLSVIKPNPELDKLTDTQLKSRFYQQLNIEEGGLYIDKSGDPMWVGDELFTKTKSGNTKLRKRERHLYLDELAKAISEPDEIYLETQEIGAGKRSRVRIVKKMFRYFQSEDGNIKGLVALFEYLPDKTQGVSAYVVEQEEVLKEKRIQRLIYSKKTRGAGH